MSRWRQARAIALLPGVMAVLLPAIILIAGDGPDVGCGLDGLAAALPVVVGATLILAGFVLWLWTVRLFARIGGGTLAPWDPTQRLVVEGPYAHARNPMITAVLAVLLGEAALFGSAGILVLAAAFLVVNHAFFRLHEEPGLERRFGEQYRAYARAVPRWVPRRRPWAPRG
ncbi:MAG TPA: isoprenylcysteine carboxylmethyltransferase family protein [Solirubrobacterales bacterium]